MAIVSTALYTTLQATVLHYTLYSLLFSAVYENAPLLFERRIEFHSVIALESFETEKEKVY
jgi:hypothetical protein